MIRFLCERALDTHSQLSDVYRGQCMDLKNGANNRNDLKTEVQMSMM